MPRVPVGKSGPIRAYCASENQKKSDISIASSQAKVVHSSRLLSDNGSSDNDINGSIHLNVLTRHGLLETASFMGTTFCYPNNDVNLHLFYMSGNPTIFGLMLYAAAHGMLDLWQIYGRQKMEGVENIEAPSVFGLSMEQLVNKAIEHGITTPYAPISNHLATAEYSAQQSLVLAARPSVEPEPAFCDQPQNAE